MKKPNPSKVIIIPQTPQNNNMEQEAPQEKTSMETQAPVTGPTTSAPKQAKAEVAEKTEDE